MSQIKAMLFDLDGTLLDSAADLVSSLNHVRGMEGLEPLPVDSMRRYASKGALGLIKAGMPPSDDTAFEARRQVFLAHYAANSHRESVPFEGVPEVLEALGVAGMPWGIVTNKIESLTFPILAATGLEKSASCVVCGDTLPERKPHPAPVRLGCERLGVRPAETLFVGDDVRDIQAGAAAGTHTAAVYYGYGSFEFTEEQVAGSYVVDKPGDLLRLIP